MLAAFQEPAGQRLILPDLLLFADHIRQQHCLADQT